VFGGPPPVLRITTFVAYFQVAACPTMGSIRAASLHEVQAVRFLPRRQRHKSSLRVFQKNNLQKEIPNECHEHERWCPTR